MRPTTGRTVLSVLIVLLFGCGAKNSDNPVAPPDSGTNPVVHQTNEGALTIYSIDRYNTIVVKIPRISSYLYLKQPRTIEQVAQDSGFALVVNASYFDRVGSGFKAVGFLKIRDSVYEPYKQDRQLLRLFAYKSAAATAAFFDTTELGRTNDYDLVVQTGPQIVRGDRVDSASIDASINGNGRYPRTALACVNGNELFVIAALDPVTLKELGGMLLSSGIFKSGLDIINFDGGPSTVIYVRNRPEFSYNAGKALPLLIGVR